MTNERQKQIFAKNLNYYIALNGKQQNEIAKDLGVKASTFNMWCRGNAVPQVSKIQKVADYFKIGKSDLIDEKLDSDPTFDAKVIADPEMMNMLKKYYELPVGDRDAIKYLIESLHGKKVAEL